MWSEVLTFTSVHSVSGVGSGRLSGRHVFFSELSIHETRTSFPINLDLGELSHHYHTNVEQRNAFAARDGLHRNTDYIRGTRGTMPLLSPGL